MSSGTAEFERRVATTLDYECCISAEGITRRGGTLSRESCLDVTENSVWVRQWAREEAPFELDLTGWTVPAIQQLRPLADKRGVHAARHDEASEVKCVSAGSRQDSFELAVRLQTMLASRHGLETNCAIELWFRRTRIREMRGSKTMTELDRSARLIRASCFCADPPMYASCEVTSDMGESASRLARDLGREAPPAGRPRGQLLFSDTAWGSVCAFVRGAFCEGAIESNEPLGYGSLGEQVLGHDVSIIRRSSSLGDVDDEGLLMEDVPLVDCGILCAYILPLQRSYQLSLPTAGGGEIGQDGRLQFEKQRVELVIDRPRAVLRDTPCEILYIKPLSAEYQDLSMQALLECRQGSQRFCCRGTLDILRLLEDVRPTGHHAWPFACGVGIFETDQRPF